MSPFTFPLSRRPYSNKYYKHWERGVYACVVCGEELFQSQTKYDAGSGWPSFYDIIDKDKVSLKQDLSHGKGARGREGGDRRIGEGRL